MKNEKMKNENTEIQKNKRLLRTKGFFGTAA